MPVDRAAYRAWDGRARSNRLVSLVIAGTMIRRILRLRLLRWALSVVLFASCIFSSISFAILHQGEANPAIYRAMQQIGLDRINLLAYANRHFQNAIGFWALMIAALAGAGLIAEDRRARALPLYFSRPLGRLDYALGKLLTVVFFLGLLLWLPPLCMYLIELALSNRDGVAGAQLPTLLRSLLPGVVGVFLLGSLALGVSSLANRHSHAALLLIGIVLVAALFGQILAYSVVEDPSWLALSPLACVHRIGIEALEVPEQLAPENPRLRKMDVGHAWTGAAAWLALGLGLLFARVRRVEVVA